MVPFCFAHERLLLYVDVHLTFSWLPDSGVIVAVVIVVAIVVYVYTSIFFLDGDV